MQVELHGTCQPEFESVRHVYEALWQDVEVGSGLSVYVDGENVINLWGGFTDRELRTAWLKDSLVNVYSTTKGPASLAFAIAVDEGLIEYGQPVAAYWPEFAARGKDRITVAEALSHQAGLCGIATPLTVSDLYDWPKMIHLLQEQQPWWPPGTAAGYHAVTWGYLPGELIRRVTGMTLGQYLAARVTRPLDADFYLGVPESELHRCVPMIGPNHARKQPVPHNTGDPKEPLPELNAVALMNPAITPFKDASSTAWRQAEIAASNGHATADGVARIYAACAMGGELANTRIISADTLLEARVAESGNEPDIVLGKPMRKARGFMLNTGGDFGPDINAYGHTGAGGSTGFADDRHRVGFGYVMNQMQADSHSSRARQLVDAFYQCLLAN